MFPYPSGNIHMGHVRNYVIGDIYARYQSLLGYKVIHPMGWDAFGLPAENAAIEFKTHPKDWTYKNIQTMKEQLSMLDLKLDWDREFATCDIEYYRFQQELFVDLYKKKLAYKKDALVNWDPIDQTVLANEQVIDGKGWRTGAEVEQKNLSQWFFKITDYAEELLDSLDSLENWPEKVKTMQRNWIGRSNGCKIDFAIKDKPEKINIFTTRPDTIFGASFIALSINHDLVDKYLTQNEIQKLKSEFSKADEKSKIGYVLPISVVHPITQKELPVYVANFILDTYGQGAIFGCPAHDERDFDFANKYKLPIIKVIDCLDDQLPYSDDGALINSDFLNGLSINDAIKKIIAYFEDKNIGSSQTNYKLRDWGVSRQRYWGCPIPVIYYEDGTYRVLEKEELPVELPFDIELNGKGNALLQNEDWRKIVCKKTGKVAYRETDTFDTFVDSSWYFIRFLNNENKEKPFDPEIINNFMPVDKYIGGIEHAILHLLYARFFTKALRDIYGFNFSEPFKELFTQGMITHKTYLNTDKKWVLPNDVAVINNQLVQISSKQEIIEGPAEKMSKSKKNVVDPREIIENYGINATRAFMVSDSPPERDLEWTDAGIQSSKNLTNRIERYFFDEKNTTESNEIFLKDIYKSLYGMGQNIMKLSLNKYIANIFTLFNHLEKNKLDINNKIGKDILICLNPLFPSLTEKIFLRLFEEEIKSYTWPEIDKTILDESEIDLPIQINGKFVATFKTEKDYDIDVIYNNLISMPKIRDKIKDKKLHKKINVQNKIINLIFN
tara:strand:+ start:7100 stop:9445 length:2346 start_codon:yes stop_codon:yes gene_type:complete